MRTSSLAFVASLALLSAACSGSADGSDAPGDDESTAAVVAALTPGVYDLEGSPFSMYVRNDAAAGATFFQISHREFDCGEVRLALTKTGAQARSTWLGCDVDLTLAANGTALAATGTARLPRAIGDFGVAADVNARDVIDLGGKTWKLREASALVGAFAAYDDRQQPMDGKLTVRTGADGKLSLSFDYLENGATTRATADAIGPSAVDVTKPSELTSHEEYRATIGRCELRLHGGRNGRGEPLFYVMRASAGCPAVGTWYRKSG